MVKIIIPPMPGGRFGGGEQSGQVIEVTKQPGGHAAWSTGDSTPEPAPEPDAGAAAQYELCLTLAAMGFHEAAIRGLRHLTARAPTHRRAWKRLAEFLRLEGRDSDAEAALAAASRVADEDDHWPRLVIRRSTEDFTSSERALQAQLQAVPLDGRMEVLHGLLQRNARFVVGMRALSQLELLAGDEQTAFCLLERALELAPGFLAARRDMVQLLMKWRSYAQALAHCEELMAQAPREVMHRALYADALRGVGRLDDAIKVNEDVMTEYPGNLGARAVYAQALHYAGRRDEAVRAFRHCIDQGSALGEAYWGLAELKGDFLSEADVAAMRAHVAADSLPPHERMLMQYGLGRVLERAGDYAGSFAAYAEGARLWREGARASGLAHDPDVASEAVRRQKRVFTPERLASLAPGEDAATAAARLGATPIFVVGMPRAGSTLVEQILGSHSLVEPTLELPVVGGMTRELAFSRAMLTPNAYPDCLLEMRSSARAVLGERFMALASAYRRTSLPWFVDKRPWNWLDIGLIHLMLPHAKIIDVRRAPMAACFGMFKQVLPTDAAFSYDLNQLGRYYAEYAHLMAHWQALLPGRIHFLSYESLVENTEAEIRAMLAFCGLPFEPGCLRFWESTRAVATPSAEQVRRPIYRDALEAWRPFEPWLGPLRAALEAPLVV